MMSAYECYKHYVALKNHFTKPSYDYFKYNGKVRLNIQSFENRKDKLYFQKLAKHPDPISYIVSNLIQDSRLWIKDIAYSESANKTYQEWLKRQQSLMYLFKSEVGKLDEDFDSNFRVESHSHPKVIKLFLAGEISIETLVILADSVRCISYWSKKFEYDPVMQEILYKITKYRPFLSYDREKVREIIVDKFSQS
jgi:T4 gene Gp59 loader of gp41 DNA helicase/T4 gene Gp59 loader of gp41 DNA helicase C-term